MKFIYIILLLVFSIFSLTMLHAQEKPKKEKKQKKEKIKLERADELEGGVFNGQKINKFKGNVVFKQKETYLYCDSAYQYQQEKSKLEAFGNVRIVQGDSITLTGNRLTYFGDVKKAIVTGNVFLRDRATTLNTEYLEYNLRQKQAYYSGGGTIHDGKSTLTSEIGYYDTDTKLFRFKRKVKVVNPSKGFTLTSDTLHYNSTTKIAIFKGPSRVESPDGIINADHGEYNTLTGTSNFVGNTGPGAQVKSGHYTLTADHIFYDEKNGMATAKTNVRLISEEDHVVIEGDRGFYWQNKGISKIFGHAVMKSVMEEDTLYLTADTLISYDGEHSPQKKLLAFNHVKIFRTDLQGKCDSLAYTFSDSTIYFYHDPVLWNAVNQITADSINIELKNNSIDKMNMRLNSFIVSQDTLRNFNQVKGRNMTGHFRKGSIFRVDVDGNGESIYYALEEEKILTGMNKVTCSNMIIRLDSNKVSTISFLQKPDGKFVPPHEILEPEKRLKGFIWRQEERPTLADIPLRKKAN